MGADRKSMDDALKRMPKQVDSLQFALAFVNAIETNGRETYVALLKLAVRMATNMSPAHLVEEVAHLKELWTLTICCEDDLEPFASWSSFAKQVEASQLRDFVETFEGFATAANESSTGGTTASSPLVQSTLLEIAKLRLDWIKTQRFKGETWEMPTAIYTRDARVQAFLRGPKVSMTLTSFNDDKHASNYSRKHRHDQVNASFNMRQSGLGVLITKTRDIFDKHRQSGGYEQEARTLSRLCGVHFVELPAASIAPPAAPKTTAGRRTIAGRGRTKLQARRNEQLKRQRTDANDIIVIND